MKMITLNKKSAESLIRPIVHKGNNPERVGKIMNKQELHEFGLGLLIAFLTNHNGNLIRFNSNTGNKYPHIIVVSPKKELLYVWVKTEMYPNIPCIESIENHEEVNKLSNQFNAVPVFAGIRLSCVSNEKNCIPVYGAGYIAEFTGLKTF